MKIKVLILCVALSMFASQSAMGQIMKPPKDTLKNISNKSCTDTVANLWNVIYNLKDSINKVDALLKTAEKEIRLKSAMFMNLQQERAEDYFYPTNAKLEYSFYVNGVSLETNLSVAPGMLIVGDGGLFLNRTFKNFEFLGFYIGASSYIYQDKSGPENSKNTATGSTSSAGISYTDEISANNSLHISVGLGVESAFPPAPHLDVFGAWLMGDIITSIGYQYGEHMYTGNHWYDAKIGWYIPKTEYRITAQACKNLGYGLSIGKLSKLYQVNKNCLAMSFDAGFYIDKNPNNDITPRFKIACNLKYYMKKKLNKW